MIAAAVLLALAVPVAGPTAPGLDACAAQIRRRDPAGVAPACWRVGPVAIGMGRETARARLGPPSASYPVDPVLAADRTTYTDDLYVLPADLGARLASRPLPAVDFKLLELTYRGDRLVRISNAPGARVSAPRCGAGPRGGKPVAVEPGSFATFERFAGVRVGDPLRSVRRRLGRPSGVSTAGDFLNYDPLPLTLDTYDGRRLGGFAVASDSTTVLLGAAPSIALDRDPVTCRTRGFHVLSTPGV